MPEQYKLSYFEIRGLAEPIRLLLIDNGIDFEDDRFDYERWTLLKPVVPLGQAPCFFHDGIPLAQSGAILRYLARKHNLYGDDLDHSAYLDMFYEAVLDARKKYYDYIYRNAESKESFIKNVHFELTRLEKLATKHPSYPPLKPGQFVGGNKISYVDYVFFEFLDTLLTLDPSTLSPVPAFKSYHDEIAKRSTLAPYLSSDKRTKTFINGNRKQ